jgi:Ca2+-binding RTX toxin-like protein
VADQDPLYTEQDIKLITGWNSVKDIEVSSISATVLKVAGFVDTWINAPTDNAGHTVSIDDAKRGAVALGNGDDSVFVAVASNEYTWSSTFDITLGDGNDGVVVGPDEYSSLIQLSNPAHYAFNSEPQLTTANITVGDGDDSVALMEVSGTIHVGNGNDTISIEDGNSALWLGSGSDTVTITGADRSGAAPFAYDTQPGSATVNFGTGYDAIFR